jgi:hypothetical protein
MLSQFFAMARVIARSIFHGGTGPFASYCDRVTLRMISNTARENVDVIRSDLARLSIEEKWASRLNNAAHPKRGFVLCLVILLAARDFLRKSRNTNEFYALGSQNPISFMNTDVVATEASFFFWFNFSIFIRHAVRNGTLIEADKEALITAGMILCTIIQATTRRAVSELFSSRLTEYGEGQRRENPSESFVRVLLRSVEKRAVDDPDRRLDPFIDLPMATTGLSMATMAYMAAMLPLHFDVYKDVTHDCPMD